MSYYNFIMEFWVDGKYGDNSYFIDLLGRLSENMFIKGLV